jgi:pyrroline-5-carboxylate reductase
MPLQKRIAFIGAGSMTEALVTGLLTSQMAQPEDLTVTDILAGRRDHMRATYGVRVAANNPEAAAWAQILVLSVEPEDMDALLEEVRPRFSADVLVISVAAGYPLARLSVHLKPETRTVRAMPNTPSSILAGVTALTFSRNTTKSDQEAATAIFEAVGHVVVVDESSMDAVTGLSGSGPAYVYLIIEALADGGVRMGLPRQVSELLAAQTVLGSARMLLESGEHPGRLKDRVASPGGTTIAGIERLEEGRFRATLMSAVEAATRRARELGSSG